jgi:hypothetical protein
MAEQSKNIKTAKALTLITAGVFGVGMALAVGAGLLLPGNHDMQRCAQSKEDIAKGFDDFRAGKSTVVTPSCRTTSP